MPSPGQILARLERLGIRLGLDAFRKLLAALGEPQRSFPPVLVAGTNGKGSTAALLAAMATAAGYRTGLYTSPHLESPAERLRLDGAAIGDPALGRLLAEVVGAAEAATGGPPTYFEAMTAAAFLWYARERVDLAVLEVGMGGRLDATNAADPILSLLTSISLDHTEHLGPTLARIAREKAGILRPGRPALAWLPEGEAADEVRRAAAELGADLRFAPERVRVERVELTAGGQRVRLATPLHAHDLTTALVGEHQAANLALAVAAAEALAGAGFGHLGPEAIARGAAACRWPGRLEKVALPGGGAVLLDAAHNPGGAAALAAFLARTERPFDLLFGALADKNADGMLAPLAARARRLVLTTPASPRALDPAALAASFPGDAEVEPEPGRALDHALGLGGETLVVCGSIYLVGEVRGLLRERFGVPAPARDLRTGPEPSI